MIPVFPGPPDQPAIHMPMAQCRPVGPRARRARQGHMCQVLDGKVYGRELSVGFQRSAFKKTKQPMIIVQVPTVSRLRGDAIDQ